MSEPVLGAAGNASSGPAGFGQDGEEKPAMGDRERDWAPVVPDSSRDATGGPDTNGGPDGAITPDDSLTPDGAVKPDGAITKVSRRRRRGSRGGRGRHTAMAVVGAAEDERPEEAAEAAEVTKVLTQGPPAPPPAKPKIGDTRPGSPPVTKRRVRKDLLAGGTDPSLESRPVADERTEDIGAQSR